MLTDGPGDGQDVGEIGGAILIGWSADGDELKKAVSHPCRRVRGKTEAPGSPVTLHHSLQTRFENGHPASIEQGDFFGVDVDAQDAIADLREASPRNQTHIATAEDGDIHQDSPGLRPDWPVKIFLY